MPLCKVAHTPFHIQRYKIQIYPLDMKGFMCHFVKWHIHPFISKDIKYKFTPQIWRVYVPLCRVAHTPLYIQGYKIQIYPLDMKGLMCHFVKWDMHPFIPRGNSCVFNPYSAEINLYKPIDQGFFDICNHHKHDKCLSYLFPLHLNV